VKPWVVGLMLAAAPMAGQTITPGRLIATDSIGHVQLDSVAHRAMTSRVEQMVCVTASVMDADTLVILRVQPAKHVVHADSTGMAMNGQPAEWWQPCIHTHFLDWPLRDYPSPDDFHSAAVRGVFGLLMIVKPDTSWSIKGYP
jgi:hypothetical protein